MAGLPAVEEVWLYGTRAMGRHHPASDIDHTLKAPRLEHADLLPWQVDLSLHASLPPDLQSHVQRVGLQLRLPGPR